MNSYFRVLLIIIPASVAGWYGNIFFTNNAQAVKPSVCEKSQYTENTKAPINKHGYVYVISNKSFGSGIHKVGMTRRNDPLKRIKELSDASVPFDFEVEEIVEAEDAVKLERSIHKKLAPYRINKGKEFFKCELDQIKTAIIQSQKR